MAVSTAAADIRELLEKPPATFDSNADEFLAPLRKGALAALREHQTVPEADVDTFWAFLARLSALRTSKKYSSQILEVALKASQEPPWAARFWHGAGDRLAVWTLHVPARPQSLEAAEAAATLLLAQCPSPRDGDAWLSAAPAAFRDAVAARLGQAQPRAAARPSDVVTRLPGPDDAREPRGSTLSFEAPPRPTPPSVSPRATDWSTGNHPASVELSRLQEQGHALTTMYGRGAREDTPLRDRPGAPTGGAVPQLPPVAHGGSNDEPRTARKPWDDEPPTATNSPPTRRQSPRELQREHLQAAPSDEPGAGRRGSLPPPPAAPDSPSVGTTAVCAFQPMGSWQHEGAPGAVLRVSQGEALAVTGRHPGWARVRRAAGQEEGWIPEGVLQLSGEVGRGVMVRTVQRSWESDELQLAVREGTALKLISRQGQWWLVDVSGVRGYVPADAVRQLQPGDRELSDAAGVKPVWVETTEHRKNVEAAGVRPAAGEGRRAAVDKKPWACGLWAYLASYYAGALCCMLGAAGALSHMREQIKYPEPMREFANSERRFAVALYSLGFGTVLLCFNWFSKIASSSESLSSSRVPVRACFFALCSLPLFASGTTMLAGIAVAFVAILSLLSFMRDEVGKAPENVKSSRDMVLPNEENTELKQVPRFSCVYWRLWWELQAVRGERPKVILQWLWAIALVGLGVYKFVTVRSAFDSLHSSMDEDDPGYEVYLDITTRCWAGELDMEAESDCSALVDLYKAWIPVAKLFGNGLNLNCSLVVLMVCQHFLMSISKRSHQAGPVGNVCRAMPTHKNLIFHKSIASVIAVTSFAHTFCHFMAHSYTLTTFDRWGYKGKWTTLSIWTTGAVIIMCIVIMYPVSREYVRRTWFEAFIYTHVTCATIFMVSLWWHAPHFYIWACVPLGLYLMDRYLRYHVVSLATVKLVEMRWLPPVMQLVFEKPWHYRAGQYVWLCCPALAWYEKHPFTIASAPETEQLCLAIKCWPGGWTERLKEFLADQCRQAMENKAGSYVKGARGTGAPSEASGSRFVFEETDWLTGQVRRGAACLAGNPERPLLQIDGPHAAPAMRYREFEVVIFAAAGIGLTPASSTLKSLLQFRWRQDAAARPHSMYFVWLCAAAEVPAFEWFMEELTDIEVAAEVNARKHGQPAAGVTAPAQPDRLVQMHLFVTRAPNAEDPQAKGPPRNPKKIQLHGDQTAAQRPYTQAELMAWMKHPKTKSDDMKEVLQKPEKSRPNQVGHTFVWNGRPQWKALFEHVKGVHKRKSPEGEAPQVGVFFCGAPAIGKDLTRSSQAYSDQDILFRIMKESF